MRSTDIGVLYPPLDLFFTKSGLLYASSRIIKAEIHSLHLRYRSFRLKLQKSRQLVCFEQGGNLTVFLGKIAHDPASQEMRDDEEEGSPSRDGVNFLTSPSPFKRGLGWGEKIESSAEALRVRHHLTIFPSVKTLPQCRASNGPDKSAKDG